MKNIGILGFGVVGSGVAEVIHMNGDKIAKRVGEGHYRGWKYRLLLHLLLLQRKSLPDEQDHRNRLHIGLLPRC